MHPQSTTEPTCAHCGAVLPSPSRRFCSRQCYAAAGGRWNRESKATRFWAKVDRNGPLPPRHPALGPCWLWTGHQGDRGYAPRGRQGAYHFAYRWAGKICPPGYELDHLCRNPGCVNPDHLEPVTHHVNILRGDAPPARAARQTHCLNGHPYNEANTYYYGPGKRSRYCRVCGREWRRRHRTAR
jgi:hypothetical protein